MCCTNSWRRAPSGFCLCSQDLESVIIYSHLNQVKPESHWAQLQSNAMKQTSKPEYILQIPWETPKIHANKSTSSAPSPQNPTVLPWGPLLRRNHRHVSEKSFRGVSWRSPTSPGHQEDPMMIHDDSPAAWLHPNVIATSVLLLTSDIIWLEKNPHPLRNHLPGSPGNATSTRCDLDLEPWSIPPVDQWEGKINALTHSPKIGLQHSEFHNVAAIRVDELVWRWSMPHGF